MCLLTKPVGMIASAVSGRIRAICTSPSLLPNILLVLFSYLVIASAWSQEDAYITLRTVDNFLHGLVSVGTLPNEFRVTRIRFG